MTSIYSTAKGSPHPDGLHQGHGLCRLVPFSPVARLKNQAIPDVLFQRHRDGTDTVVGYAGRLGLETLTQERDFLQGLKSLVSIPEI